MQGGSPIRAAAVVWRRLAVALEAAPGVAVLQRVVARLVAR
jgi:hypothetical protein